MEGKNNVVYTVNPVYSGHPLGSNQLAALGRYGSREGQFPRWRSAVRVRSEGSAVKAPQ